ncbi:MAG: RNA recognition motif domain-containing protein [Stenomitos frigidus ULC029]
MTIYVGNLSFQATEEDLQEVFAEYGEVGRISLPTDRETGRKRGFAFVEMKDEAKEDLAISELDGAEWLGRELKVNKAKPRESARPAGGGRNFSNSSTN